MIEGLEAFCRDMHAFPVELKNFDAFPPRVIFVDVIKSEALENLQYQQKEPRVLKVPRAPHHTTIRHRSLTLASTELPENKTMVYSQIYMYSE